MHSSFAALVAVVFLGVSQAIQVTKPALGDFWQSGQSGQTVEWQAVSTDPTSFAIELVNQAGFLQNSPVVLVANQSTGSSGQTNSATVTFPNGPWPTGTGFQINLISSSTGQAAILAQSQQFNITGGGSNSTMPSSSASSPTTLSGVSASPSGSASLTGSAPNGDASGGIPNANATKTGAAYPVLAGPSFASLLLGAVGLVAAF